MFETPPPGRPPERGTEHIIELEEGTKPIMTTHYRYPKTQKDEIENIIKELLDIGYIRPSKSPFASAVVLVKKKGWDHAYVCGLLSPKSKSHQELVPHYKD